MWVPHELLNNKRSSSFSRQCISQYANGLSTEVKYLYFAMLVMMVCVCVKWDKINIQLLSLKVINLKQDGMPVLQKSHPS